MLKIQESTIEVWLDERYKAWEARCQLDYGIHISAVGATKEEALSKLRSNIMLERNDFETEVILEVIGGSEFAIKRYPE